MTPPGALALTGAILILLLAFPCGVAASASSRIATRFGWVALGMGAACLTGAAWWEALS